MCTGRSLVYLQRLYVILHSGYSLWGKEGKSQNEKTGKDFLETWFKKELPAVSFFASGSGNGFSVQLSAYVWDSDSL